MTAALTAFRHTDTGIWSAEASELGFAPGDWPVSFTALIEGEHITCVGSGDLHRDAEGDLQYVDYRVPGRMTLRVWND